MHLLPRGYPHSVSAWYLPFASWHALSATASSAAGVLAMQSMLYAVGVGSGSVALAGAVNWVLKDGIGQLGGMLFASRTATGFDSNPQRWRLISAVALDVACCLEVATAAVPALFLPLAAVANIGKNVAWLSASATRASMHQSASNTGALADVTAKSGSQSMAASTLGTGVGIILSPIVGTDPATIAPAFLLLSCVHIGALLQSMRHVALRSLNESRLEAALQTTAGTAPPHQCQVLAPEAVLNPSTQSWSSIMTLKVPTVTVNAPLPSLPVVLQGLVSSTWSASPASTSAGHAVHVSTSAPTSICVAHGHYTVLVDSGKGAWTWLAHDAPADASLTAYLHALLLLRCEATSLQQLQTYNNVLLEEGIRSVEQQLQGAGWNTAQPLLEPLQRQSLLQGLASAVRTAVNK